MNYRESVDWLFQQFPAWHLQGAAAYKPGLENVEALAAQFGNPERSLAFVHVAGTNGKGSVSSMLASVFMEDGKKTGLFTSPHLFDFRERIRVNGITVPEQYVVDFCEKIRQTDLAVKPSFFEITWIMALCYFRDQQCEIVIAETGLGGRLDATNIVSPVLSVITNIGLDHTAILGNTRAEIASEKAGIIKPRIPVVLGESDAEIFGAISQKANDCNSELIVVAQPGTGNYVERNRQTVRTACLQLLKTRLLKSEKSIRAGIAHVSRNTGLKGRMQQVGTNPLIIADAAHNPDGIEQLLKSVGELEHSSLHIVYGTSSDKDFSAIVGLFPSDAQLYVTTFSNPRSATTDQLREVFGPKARYFQNAGEAFEQAKKDAGPQDLVLITGSFFLLQEFEDLLSTSA